MVGGQQQVFAARQRDPGTGMPILAPANRVCLSGLQTFPGEGQAAMPPSDDPMAPEGMPVVAGGWALFCDGRQRCDEEIGHGGARIGSVAWA
jgi:hypothetical protein